MIWHDQVIRVITGKPGEPGHRAIACSPLPLPAAAGVCQRCAAALRAAPPYRPGVRGCARAPRTAPKARRPGCSELLEECNQNRKEYLRTLTGYRLNLDSTLTS